MPAVSIALINAVVLTIVILADADSSASGFIHDTRQSATPDASKLVGNLDGAFDDALDGERVLLELVSSHDGTTQPSYLIYPSDYDQDQRERALLVVLHTWSGDLNQRHQELEALADERGWLYLFPNFRGANDDPTACGSESAQQDILDAVNWCRENLRVDQSRIYLTGTSGGGHMTMLMVAKHPTVWTAASAWVGISDLSRWHQQHAADGGRYARMLESCCGGAPGDSPEIDSQYHDRSPIHFLSDATEVPLDLAAGIHDGHRGSVPIHHTLDAFNILAHANGTDPVTDAELALLSQPDGRLERPQPSDEIVDASFDREIHLRRHSGRCRVTIFEGGHEGISAAAIDWLARHEKTDEEDRR